MALRAMRSRLGAADNDSPAGGLSEVQEPLLESAQKEETILIFRRGPARHRMSRLS